MVCPFQQTVTSLNVSTSNKSINKMKCTSRTATQQRDKRNEFGHGLSSLLLYW